MSCSTNLPILGMAFFSSAHVMVNMHSGDRTPKQKVKLKVTEEKLLNLMLKYNGGKPRSEVQCYI